MEASEETLRGTIVRGSQPRVEFPMIGPISKYVALFDARPMFDGLREAFFCSRKSTYVSLLETTLEDASTRNDFAGDILQPALDYSDVAREIAETVQPV